MVTVPRLFRSAFVGAALLAVIWSGTVVFAADNQPAYVFPDGRKTTLVKSSDEVAITLRDCQEADACARRLMSKGRGVMKSIEGAEDAPHRLLKVADTSVARIASIKQDPSILEVRPVYRFEGVDSPMLSSGSLLAKVPADLTDADRSLLWASYRVRVTRAVEGLPNVYRLEPMDEDGDEVAVAELMSADSRVIWAQPNFRRSTTLHQSLPTDQYFNQQWHLRNTGQTGGTPGADINAVDAWNIARGLDILIGIYDDAVDVDHEDLRDNYIGRGQDVSLQFNNPDYNNPRPKVFGDRHGTAVAGLAVARANSLGVLGVAHLSRFTASRGVTGLLTADQVATGFTFARQENVDVHVNSWGRPGANEQAVEEAIRLAFTDGRTTGEGMNQQRLGMVVVFASGNEGVENQVGFSYSTMPEVLGVGASTDMDKRAEYSNWGSNINVLAPSNGGFGQMVTTDNDDNAGYVDDGYNVGGSEIDSGITGLDTAGKYTRTFGGTSAACPVAAGVAALVLSANRMLTATDVKLILEHTCDQIDPTVAQYNGITSRSRQYGYGRLNARRAAQAASQSLTNGNRTWPDRAGNVSVSGSRLQWQSGVGTQEFFVVESDSPFSFIPIDGACYHADQLGCGATPLTGLPAGVTAHPPVSCNGTCAVGSVRSIDFLLPAGRKYFGIYARSSIGRYSFGVSVDSDGNVVDGGPVIGGGDGGGGDGGGGGGGDVGGQPVGPRVTVSVSPLEGVSPLTVQFMGNAISAAAIDESQTVWDFDISSLQDVNAFTRNASYTYTVASGEQTFVARLTMKDVNGVAGSAQVMIRVRAASSGSSGPVGSSDVRILVGVPGTVDSDVDTGTSPFSVELKVDATTVVGTLLSVIWDLGDGTTANSIVVPHTYINTTGQTQVFPVTATVTTTVGSQTISTLATRLVTVRSGAAPTNPPSQQCQLQGTCAGGGQQPAGCGAFGLIPSLGLLTGLSFLRRRRS